MIAADDYLTFADEAIDGMIAIVTELGDELANRCLDTPDANSPYQVLTHCLGVMEYWAGYLIAKRWIERDRDAEFVAIGSVADLVAHARRAQAQLREDLIGYDPVAPPRGKPRSEDSDLALARTQGGILLHVYEELAQHRGQMEVTRDVLLASWAKTS